MLVIVLVADPVTFSQYFNPSSPYPPVLAMPTPYRLVLCTCPDVATAETLAQFLVTNRLAACVNILPVSMSIYWWQGQVEAAEETLLLIKTDASRFSQLQDSLSSRHPYEVPEIISLNIEDGYLPYLNWIGHSLHGEPAAN